MDKDEAAHFHIFGIGNKIVDREEGLPNMLRNSQSS